MFFMEQMVTEKEALNFIQEALYDPGNVKLREELIDPVISVLEKPEGRKQYIEYGSSFIGDNSEMLAREYPTKPVTFPRKYVNGLLGLFGFTVKSIRTALRDVLKSVNATKDFNTIVQSPTNVIHSIALFYSDMIMHRQLRDSARQQIGLSVYAIVYNKFFKT